MGSDQKRKFLGMFVVGLSLTSGLVQAEQQYASKERATVARAHMSRARTLLVEALAEFEESKKYARPDMLIDSEDWRLRVISLTEQLNRVVDPKPRLTREGAVFRTPPRFVRRQKEQLPDSIDGPKTRSDVGERARLKQKQQERAQFFSGVAEANKVTDPKKSNLAKLPVELQLPDEPVLDSSVKSNENAKQLDSMEKKGDLFTNELMPEVNGKDSDKLPAKNRGLGENTDNVLPDDEKTEFDPKPRVDNEDIKNSDISKKMIEKDVVTDDILDNEISGATSKPRANDSILPPTSKNSEILDSVKSDPNTSTTKNTSDFEDDEASDLPPEVAEKQLSEDETLAKKLEDSISKKLSDRNSETN